MTDDEAPAEKNRALRIDFPFLVYLDHEPIGLADMFRLTEALDFYEIEPDPSGARELVKHTLTVDVVEVTPTDTTIKITPTRPVSYDVLSAHLDALLKRIGKSVLKKAPKLKRLRWEIAKFGVASDMRGMLRSI
jgi:hypothetical protein